MNCGCNMGFRLIYAVDGIRVLTPFDEYVKKQIERGFLAARQVLVMEIFNGSFFESEGSGVYSRAQILKAKGGLVKQFF